MRPCPAPLSLYWGLPVITLPKAGYRNLLLVMAVSEVDSGSEVYTQTIGVMLLGLKVKDLRKFHFRVAHKQLSTGRPPTDGEMQRENILRPFPECILIF